MASGSTEVTQDNVDHTINNDDKDRPQEEGEMRQQVQSVVVVSRNESRGPDQGYILLYFNFVFVSFPNRSHFSFL